MAPFQKFQKTTPPRPFIGRLLETRSIGLISEPLPIEKGSDLGPPRLNRLGRPRVNSSISRRKWPTSRRRHRWPSRIGHLTDESAPVRTQFPSELAHPGRRNPERAGHAARCLTENQFFGELPVPVRQC